MDTDKHCRDKVAPPGSSLYYATLYLPSAQQNAVIAVQAWRAEIASALAECSDPGVARIKLQWWREEVDRAFAGQARHPVTQALSPHIEPHGLTKETFRAVIDVHDRELDRPLYPDRDSLEQALTDLGTLWQISAQICGAENAHDAQALGKAIERSESVQDLRQRAGLGAPRVAQDELEGFNLRIADLQTRTPRPEAQEFAALQVRRAMDGLAHALAAVPRQDRRAQLMLRILAAIHCRTLEEIEKDGFRILQHRISLTPVRKLWLAWTTRWLI